MKALLVADLHIHPHKKSTERLEDCLKVLDWVFQTALNYQIPHIIFLGDLFHERQKIDVLTYQRTFEIFEKHLVSNPPFQVWLLLGNHDLWHLQKWDVSSVNPLRTIQGIHVIDKPSTQVLQHNGESYTVGFLPYTHNPVADLVRVDESWEGSTDQRVLCGHVAIDGAIWNAKYGTISEVSVEHDGDMVRVGPDIFQGWDQVFLGHYHAEQQLNNNVEYVGSPLQLSFGEAFQKKHILIYDFNTGDKNYIENTFSPKHYVVKESELDQYDLEGHFVRVEVDDISSSVMVEMREDLVNNRKVGSLQIEQTSQVSEEEEHIVQKAKDMLKEKESEMLEQYVEQIKTDMDKEKLLEIGKTICEKAG